jgi:hypothetical protein
VWCWILPYKNTLVVEQYALMSDALNITFISITSNFSYIFHRIITFGSWNHYRTGKSEDNFRIANNGTSHRYKKLKKDLDFWESMQLLGTAQTLLCRGLRGFHTIVIILHSSVPLQSDTEPRNFHALFWLRTVTADHISYCDSRSHFFLLYSINFQVCFLFRQFLRNMVG